MQRIKKIEDVILNTGNVLIKLILKSSKIIVVSDVSEKKATASNSEDYDVEYGIVVAIGARVDDIVVGDIVLDFKSNVGMEVGDDKYVIGNRLSINVAVKPDNFDPKRNLKKITA